MDVEILIQQWRREGERFFEMAKEAEKALEREVARTPVEIEEPTAVETEGPPLTRQYHTRTRQNHKDSYYQRVIKPKRQQALASLAENTPSSINADLIKEIISSRGARPQDIAELLHCTKEDVVSIISDETNGLIKDPRGWVKLDPQLNGA